MKTQMELGGYAISATETQSGNALMISDLVLTMDEGTTGGPDSAEVTLPDMTFTENGDGTVNGQWPKDFTLSMSAANQDKGFAVDLNVRTDGSPSVYSGDPDAITNAYSTELLELSLVDFEIDGTAPPDSLKYTAKVSLADVALKNETSRSTGQVTLDQSGSASSLSYNFDISDTAEDFEITVTGGLQDLGFSGSSGIPIGMEPGMLFDMVKAGLAGNGGFSFGASQSNGTGKGDGNSFAWDAKSNGGNFNVTMDQSGVSYDASQKDAEITIAASDLPFPMSISLAEAGLKLAMPLLASDDEQSFALGMTLKDFSLSDMIWDMFDPAATLPRDPATFVVDLDGKGVLGFDLMDPASIATLEAGDTEPGQLNALTLKQLLISAAGTKLSGTGDFTFNNDDLETYDGFPAPVGSANLLLDGANGLIDRLIKMGLMDEGDAMGARMMMGILTVPGSGEDSLTSRIELTEDGKLLANGQRLK